MAGFPNTKGYFPSFGQAIMLIGVAVAGALVLQQGHGRFGSMVDWTLAIGGISGLALLIYSKRFLHVIDSPYFAISNLLAIALATIIGTFISQTVPPEVFTERYGEVGSQILRVFQLDDVFHSWWYVSLFILLLFSIIKISWKKKWNRWNLGFHLAHLSPVLILAGFWIDHFFGYRGIIQLEEGQQKNIVRLYAGLSNYIADSTSLDFSIQLDDFDFQKYDPDYRMQIWKRDTSTQQPVSMTHGGHMPAKPPTIIASLPLEPMKIRHIYGTDLYFRLKEFYPDFSFKYTYPLLAEEIEPVDPGIQIDIFSPEGDGTLQLLANNPNRNKVMNDDFFGGWLEFYWELTDEVKSSFEEADSNSANRVIFTGKDSMAYYVINGKVTFGRLKVNEDFTIPGAAGTKLHILHIFPDASLLKAEPSSRTKELKNPVARVEIWHKGQSAQEAYIYPRSMGPGGQYSIPGSAFILALESFKDQESKYYKSDISVVDRSGNVVKQRTIVVNEPLFYKGHRFYQTDYDPKNPAYSGIGVTHEPGLPLIYSGFYLLVIGVGLMFYAKASSRLH